MNFDTVNPVVSSDKMFDRALQIASKAHENHVHSAGEPFIEHPLRIVNTLETSGFLFRYGLGSEVLQAALMHDVVEDTEITIENLKTWDFSFDVRDMVESLTLVLPEKTKPLPKHELKQWVLLGHASVMRSDAALIKLVDRLDNVKALKYRNDMSEKAKARYARYGVQLAQILIGSISRLSRTTVTQHATITQVTNFATSIYQNIFDEASKYVHHW